MAGDRLAKNIVSTTLRVFIGEHWPERPTTPWVALDAAGEIVRQGESDALHWPETEYCEAVISAPQVSWLRADIPDRVARLDLQQVVASSLEDRLLEDPDQCQLTLYRREGAVADVLVVSRTRLRNVLAQFEALKRPLTALYSELQARQPAAPGCAVILATEAAIVHHSGEPPLSMDWPSLADPPPLLGMVIQRLGVSSDDPVVVCPGPGIALDLPRWRNELAMDGIALGPEYRWHELDAKAVNLLHHEFESKQRRSNLWLLVRAPAIVAAMALTAYVVIALLQVGLQQYRIGGLEDRIAELFHGEFPRTPIVAPLAQARQRLDSLRGANGLLRSDDALSLLAAVADVLGADGKDAVRSINFEKHRLTVALVPGWSSRLDAVRRQLSARGLVATVASGPLDSPSIVVERNLAK